MRAYTVRAHRLFAIKAITDLSALFLTNTAADLASIATLSNSEKTQETVVEKTGRQIIETISFREANFGLALGTSKFSLFLAYCCVFLQARTAEGMKTSYGLGFGVSIQTNRTSNLFLEAFLRETPSQTADCETTMKSNTPVYCVCDSEKS